MFNTQTRPPEHAAAFAESVSAGTRAPKKAAKKKGAAPAKKVKKAAKKAKKAAKRKSGG